MKKQIITIIILVSILLGINAISNSYSKQTDPINGLTYFPPGLGMYENYTKDSKTYESGAGFSFKYPPYLYAQDLSDEDTERVLILPISILENDDVYGVVVSVGFNDEMMTAEEWLLGPDSGYSQSRDKYGDYHKIIIDGQGAVYTSGGTWVVVNTPDNKYRLSIALLSGEDGNLLFTEMGIIIDSLRFVK